MLITFFCRFVRVDSVFVRGDFVLIVGMSSLVPCGPGLFAKTKDLFFSIPCAITCEEGLQNAQRRLSSFTRQASCSRT